VDVVDYHRAVREFYHLSRTYYVLKLTVAFCIGLIDTEVTIGILFSVYCSRSSNDAAAASVCKSHVSERSLMFDPRDR